MSLQNWIEVKHPPPHDKNTWVCVIAYIRNNKTGAIRQYETNDIWDEETSQPNIFIWEEGNFSCDCNRKLFWGRANNEEYNEDEIPCGHDGFDVNLENPKTKEIFYREYNDT